MATILIDYENVTELGLHGVNYLNNGDTLIIFYSQAAKKMKEIQFDYIKNSKCKVETVKLERTGKNGLDFYIATKIGYIIGTEQENYIGIVSKDKGYQAVLDYWKSIDKELTIVQGTDIVRTLLQMGDSQNRKRRDLMRRECTEIDIEAKFVELINKQKKVEHYKETFAEYPDDIDAIVEFMDSSMELNNKDKYLKCMKVFGIGKGRLIYNKIKEMYANEIE